MSKNSNWRPTTYKSLDGKLLPLFWQGTAQGSRLRCNSCGEYMKDDKLQHWCEEGYAHAIARAEIERFIKRIFEADLDVATYVAIRSEAHKLNILVPAYVRKTK